MAIEALKRIFQVPAIRKEKEVNFTSYGQRRPRPRKERKKDRPKVDIRV
jgi:hypothetical protein